MITDTEIEQKAFNYAYGWRDEDVKIQSAAEQGYEDGYRQALLDIEQEKKKIHIPPPPLPPLDRINKEGTMPTKPKSLK